MADPAEMNVEALRLRSFDMDLWPLPGRRKCNPKNMAKAGFYHTPTEASPDLVQCYCCHKELDGWEPSDDPMAEHKKHAPQCPLMNLSLYDSRVATFAGWSSQCEATPEEFARAGWMFKPQSVGGDEVECFSCKAVLGGWEKGDNPLEEHRARATKGRKKCTFMWSLQKEQKEKEAMEAQPLPPAAEAPTPDTPDTVVKTSSKTSRVLQPSKATNKAATKGKKEVSKKAAGGETPSKKVKVLEDAIAPEAAEEEEEVGSENMTVEEYLRALCDSQVHQVVRAAEAKIAEFQEAAEETRLELAALRN